MERKHEKKEKYKSLLISFPENDGAEDGLKRNRVSGGRIFFGKLEEKFDTFRKIGLQKKESFELLIKAAVELTTQEAPKWEMIAARLHSILGFEKVDVQCSFIDSTHSIKNLFSLQNKDLYGAIYFRTYTKEEIDRLETIYG